MKNIVYKNSLWDLVDRKKMKTVKRSESSESLIHADELRFLSSVSIFAVKS